MYAGADPTTERTSRAHEQRGCGTCSGESSPSRILVVIHEGGHFLAARVFGVKVHEFMIGLPGPAFRFQGKRTTYGVTAIPLGGYVRIAGMEPGPEDPLLGPALAASSPATATMDADRLAGL